MRKEREWQVRKSQVRKRRVRKSQVCFGGLLPGVGAWPGVGALLRAVALLGVVALSLAISGCGSSSSPPSSPSSHQSHGEAADTAGRIHLIYRAQAGSEPVTDSNLEATIEIMRKRIEGLGVNAEIQRSGANKIVVGLPNASNATRAREVVGKTGQLYFYDWEPNVIGPSGKPAPSEATVTGGSTAGGVETGLLEYPAVLRAAKRPAILRENDTTWSTGCTPTQTNGCLFGGWYLLDTKHEKVLGGPEETERSLYANSYKPSAGATVRAVRVEPGTLLVRARPMESVSGRIVNTSPNSWYVLDDNPVLTGGDIVNPAQSSESIGEDAEQPNVTFGFTSSGAKIFEQLTKEVAHRGQEAQLPGVSKETALQHFAIVLDNQVLTAPSIDYTKYPEGIDAAGGSEISGSFTTTSAQNLADELRYGVLPLKLALIARGNTAN
jgi:SecD/SecF fusion protein